MSVQPEKSDVDFVPIRIRDLSSCKKWRPNL